MSTLLALIVGCARTWVGVYTLGLAAAVKEARRREIDSDLWEQQWLASRRGESLHGTAAEIAARAVLGMLSDITWRVQAGLSTRPERRIKVNESPTMRALVLVGLAVAAFPIVIGFLVAVGLNGETDSTERTIFGPVQIVVGSAIVSGLLMSARRPVLGISLVAVGAITMWALWYWMLVITIPIGIALIAIAYFRGRTASRGIQPRGTGTA